MKRFYANVRVSAQIHEIPGIYRMVTLVRAHQETSCEHVVRRTAATTLVPQWRAHAAHSSSLTTLALTRGATGDVRMVGRAEGEIEHHTGTCRLHFDRTAVHLKNGFRERKTEAQ